MNVRERVGEAAVAVTAGLVLVLAAGCASGSPSDAGHEAELARLRKATAAYQDVQAAETAGYAKFGNCFRNADVGDMGIHWASDARIGTPAVELLDPELLVYAPQADGSLRLVALEYIVFRDAWHAAGNSAPPALLGREFALDETTLDEPFYKLHVWLWHDNPHGLMADWNPNIRCPEGT